ncbi:hypothetical protein BC831DRAFT_460542 [Entophlyctis helioformis]|nr:hypothetical protein BC831DRAFT_460542 [Entophlyctis helioformis]
MPAVAVPAAVCCCWSKMRFGSWLAGWLAGLCWLPLSARQQGEWGGRSVGCTALAGIHNQGRLGQPRSVSHSRQRQPPRTDTFPVQVAMPPQQPISRRQLDLCQAIVIKWPSRCCTTQAVYLPVCTSSL